ISIGEDAVAVSQISFQPPAIRNVHVALRDDIGIRSISVSTTFSFINIVTALRPSAATFQEPIGGAVIRPLLKFLEDTNSFFLVNLYPHNMYGFRSQISPRFALFHEGASNFGTGVRVREDEGVDEGVGGQGVLRGVQAVFPGAIGGAMIRPLLKFLEDTNSSFLVNLYPHNMYEFRSQISSGFALFHEGASNFGTGVRNGNPFEMMVDAVVTSLEVAGHGNIPLIVFVAETGEGTPLRKEGVVPAYIYELVEA
ncbi:unnamed protein product, partial [Linum tenue]